MSYDAERMRYYIVELNEAEMENTAEFNRLLKESETLLKLSDRELARAFTISVPSVTRWRNGTSSPHSVMRPIVYKYLVDKTLEILKRENLI
jgi:DNA-binding transcriptional regulator YiaG